ncbi:MAG: LD-carboxypeptidase [Bacteroidales bacterium]|nr:LD-carboxypeptidase [Bacteroidales bacterium]
MKTHYLLLAAGLLTALSSCHKDKEDEVIINEIHVDTTVVYSPSFIIENKEEVTTDIRPQFLQKGDKVAVCAISNAVSESDVSEGEETLKNWGLEVLEASNLYAQDSRYAGSLKERISGLQEMLDNDDVRAIFFARGGYGAAQVLPFLDWTKFKKSPKWIIGYSDVTALHITLNNMGYETILGPMMRGFNKDGESVEMLKDILFGDLKGVSIEKNSNCIDGVATARLVGGNLSILYSLSGTAFDINTKNSVLFIEDTGEANYSVDRMLLNLQQSGKLQEIKGVIIGEFIGGSQGSDLPLNEIFAKYFSPLNVPVIYGVPNGHDTQNYPIILGAKTTINVSGDKAEMTYSMTAK